MVVTRWVYGWYVMSLTRYHKISFIFVISMVDLVGIDVHMSYSFIMKIRTLAPSIVLTICFIESPLAVILFITMFSTTYTSI